MSRDWESFEGSAQWMAVENYAAKLIEDEREDALNAPSMELKEYHRGVVEGVKQILGHVKFKAEEEGKTRESLRRAS